MFVGVETSHRMLDGELTILNPLSPDMIWIFSDRGTTHNMYNRSLCFVHWPGARHVDQGQHLLRFLHAQPVVLEFGMQAFSLTIILGALLPLFLSLTLIQFFFPAS